MHRKQKQQPQDSNRLRNKVTSYPFFSSLLLLCCFSHLGNLVILVTHYCYHNSIQYSYHYSQKVVVPWGLWLKPRQYSLSLLKLQLSQSFVFIWIFFQVLTFLQANAKKRNDNVTLIFLTCEVKIKSSGSVNLILRSNWRKYDCIFFEALKHSEI